MGSGLLAASDRPRLAARLPVELSYLSQQKEEQRTKPDAPELGSTPGQRLRLEGQFCQGLSTLAAGCQPITRFFPALPLLPSGLNLASRNPAPRPGGACKAFFDDCRLDQQQIDPWG